MGHMGSISSVGAHATIPTYHQHTCTHTQQFQRTHTGDTLQSVNAPEHRDLPHNKSSCTVPSATDTSTLSSLWWGERCTIGYIPSQTHYNPYIPFQTHNFTNFLSHTTSFMSFTSFIRPKFTFSLICLGLKPSFCTAATRSNQRQVMIQRVHTM